MCIRDRAIAALVLSLLFDTISADPAVSALTCSVSLFDFINFEQEKDEEGFEALVQKKMLSLSLKKAREFFEREYI